MKNKLITSGSVFEQQAAYSRAVFDGNYIFVSGTTGFDYQSMAISDSVVAQAEQCFKNINTVLSQLQASLADIVRINYIVPNRDDFEPCWPVLRKYLGDIKPASTMIIAGLFDPRMKIEIEVTARVKMQVDDIDQ